MTAIRKATNRQRRADRKARQQARTANRVAKAFNARQVVEG